MKKIAFRCVGNTLLFTLVGLAFLFPFSEITQMEMGFQGNVSIFPFLLAAYFIAYPIIHYIFAKKNRWGEKDNSELAYSDEREKAIVAESTKIAYMVLVGGLIIAIVVIGGVKFFSMSTGMDISIYATSIALLTVLLDIATISYCVKWCLEYKK